MKRFWNWIRNEAGGRVLRLEGPIDEESFWGDEVTPKAFREELEADSATSRSGSTAPAGTCLRLPRSIRCSGTIKGR